MSNEVKINLSTTKDLRDRLKAVADHQGMKFHNFLNLELKKVLAREEKKLGKD